MLVVLSALASIVAFPIPEPHRKLDDCAQLTSKLVFPGGDPQVFTGPDGFANINGACRADASFRSLGL
jgi:hypothetical protein